MRDASGFPSACNVETLFSLFDRIHIVLGSILVNPRMKVIFEKQNSSFANMTKFDQARTKAIWKNWKYGLKSIKKKFDTDLTDICGFPSSRNFEAFFGTFRSNSYRFRVDFG